MIVEVFPANGRSVPLWVTPDATWAVRNCLYLCAELEPPLSLSCAPLHLLSTLSLFMIQIVIVLMKFRNVWQRPERRCQAEIVFSWHLACFQIVPNLGSENRPWLNRPTFIADFYQTIAHVQSFIFFLNEYIRNSSAIMSPCPWHVWSFLTQWNSSTLFYLIVMGRWDKIISPAINTMPIT